MLPEGWKRQTVADICQMQNGNGFGPEDWGTEGYPIIRIQNLNGGTDFDYYSGPVQSRWFVEPGELLFAWAGTKGVSFGPAIWRGQTGVLNQHIFKVSAKQGVDPGWLHCALRFVTDRIEANAHGFKATLVHVKKSDIDRQEVLVPELSNQRRIAEILRTWDEAIAVAEKFLANSRRQKDGLMELLLGKKRRLHGHTTKRRAYRLSELFSERVEANRGDLPLLSITREEGLIPRAEVGRKDTSNEDKSKYLRVCPGDIAYNTMRMWQGVSALSTLEGIISPAYTVVVPKKLIDAQFAAYLFKYPPVVFRFYRYSQGLVSDTWNLKFPHFSEIKVEIPELGEQIAIAKVLKDADSEIAVLEKELDYLREEKRALMADLLTGKRRVRLPETSTEPEAT